MTRLISWTLCGERDADILPDALRSVEPIVDSRLVVWTGADINSAGRIIITESLERDPFRTWWAHFPWRDDFAAARNAALAAAAEMKADWGAMVDSDERVICPDPAAFRAWLTALPPEAAIVLAYHHDGSHTRERLFRLPQPARFVGRTHETIAPAPGTVKVLAPKSLIAWDELPKSPEQLRAKWHRDLDMLCADVEDDPTNGAANYYMGETLQSLGRHEEAIDAFREHNRLSTWEEGRAWACFKAAESYFALGQPYRVLECAAQGLVHDAGMAELYWIASVACWAEAAKVVESGADPRKAWEWVEQARCWGEVARVHGAGSKAEARRVGKRDLRGLGPGVDEVLGMVAAVGEPQPTPAEHPTCANCAHRRMRHLNDGPCEKCSCVAYERDPKQCEARHDTGLVGEFRCSLPADHDGQHQAWAIDGILTPEERESAVLGVVGSPEHLDSWCSVCGDKGCDQCRDDQT